jgi:hypothetical protein
MGLGGRSRPEPYTYYQSLERVFYAQAHTDTVRLTLRRPDFLVKPMLFTVKLMSSCVRGMGLRVNLHVLTGSEPGRETWAKEYN